MAEGLLIALYGDRYEALSAGTKPATVNPYAINAMAEIGIDISRNQSKDTDEFQGITFDYVVTVCDNAKADCPFFPGAKEYLHKSFDDPSGFNGTDDEKLICFRRVRDEIKDWLIKTFGRKDE
ncbi:MAG: Arsenate reductase [Candidatus Scalindua arabica]|uniref:Arsenate reductase n=1 Tax=Candidatus Scalindua arabica TaxID=1127984 RepID=A0A941W2T6_9BACT|nr:Arsenate reductase [Candidatus Scalindua arabica]